ncbi:hypothetical protein, partial [Klebsiella pneumoniae]
LATLVMPETRLKARSKQLSLRTDLEMQVLDEAGKIVTDAAMLKTLDRKALPVGYRLEPDVAGFRRKLNAPGREMIGAEQREWLR